jgi:hypothetical protein
VIPDDVAAVKQLLSNLPAGAPDAARAARVRTRCRAELARRTPGRSTYLPAAIVGGFCLVYLFGVIVMALRSEGIL